MSKKQQKPVQDMTNDEIANLVFPKPVAKALKKIAAKKMPKKSKKSST